MIQDIAPAQLSLHYDLRTVDAGDIVCLFSGRRILAVSAPAGTLHLPRFCELPGITEADCWFLSPLRASIISGAADRSAAPAATTAGSLCAAQ